MKKIRFFTPLIAVMIVFPYLSCKSAPPAEGSAPAPQPLQVVDQEPSSPASPAELSAAIDRAAAARQRAMDFESPAYFPSEWDAAEAQYTQAGRSQRPDAYNAVADVFDSLFEKTIPLYAQAIEDEILALRDNLIDAGVRDSEPDYFLAADETALSALDLYEAKEYYAALESAAVAHMMYETMSLVYDALLMQTEIVEREFESYDQNSFDQAGELLVQTTNAYREGEVVLAYESAHVALQKYTIVLNLGLAAYAELRSSLAEAERQAAIDVKANIATRDLFAEADSNFKLGVNAFDSRHYREAANQFINSEALFVIASVSAMEKRRNAADAIREAHERIEESAETARQAEIIIEGGAE